MVVMGEEGDFLSGDRSDCETMEEGFKAGSGFVAVGKVGFEEAGEAEEASLSEVRACLLLRCLVKKKQRWTKSLVWSPAGRKARLSLYL